MIETDALVIGAGPAGLFAVFELGLQGVTAHVVDVLDEPGGQCIELYPDKPIFDIPGVPRCTGRELAERLLQQVKPFSPTFHLGQQVETLARQTDGRWHLSTRSAQHGGQEFLARNVIIAAGVGAFVPKPLRVDGLTPLEGSQVFYRLKPVEAFIGKRVVVVGGEDTAVQAAITLAQAGLAASVTLLHRRDVLQASAADLAGFAELRAEGRVSFIAGQVSTADIRDQHLHGVVVDTPEGGQQTLTLDVLLVCQGISPKVGPLTQWGLAMQRKQLCVDTATFATSEPGVFAIGDVVDYPGKRKLIVSGFHEATLAAFAVAALLHPGTPQTLQYTTSSALLQRRLGVAGTAV